MQDKLTEISSSDENVIGKGITNLYKYLSSKFIGITRNAIRDRVNAIPVYQLQKNYKHRINKPITATGNNLLWCTDLIDLNFMKFAIVIFIAWMHLVESCG